MKLTRRQRHEIYKRLISGEPTSNFIGIEFERLEWIWKEFHPGPGKPPVDNRPRGIQGNKWFCEVGCGAVMLEKKDHEAFKAADRSQGGKYACPACREKLKQIKERKQNDTISKV